ncbi:MAG TPA: HAD-IC family P-type ATPase [Acidimicrobiales bacterium]|nr:HAD-IC family P-type ATPase [Acidimicrobiales bacterium]
MDGTDSTDSADGADGAGHPAEVLPDGLTTAEAADRTARGLTNRAPVQTSRSLTAIVRANVFTRFNAILGILLVVILTIGPIQDAFFGLVLVLNTAIGIVQEWRAKQTLDRLSLLNMPAATVVRDGARHDLPVDELVQGDVVELTPGAQIVADGAVVVADALEIDESLLTGESVPEAKGPADQVMSGSFVTAGRGWYRADKVGAEAYANTLASEARKFSLVRSELRQGTDLILRLVTWLIVPVAVLLIYSQLRSDESLNNAIRGTVAGVGAMIPEGLVLLTSLAFAASVVRLGRRQVLVQELAAIEGLARVDVVCIDKTGTITEPILEVVAVEAVATDDRVPEQLIEEALGALAWADREPNASLAALAKRFRSPGWTPVWRAAFSSARRFSGAGFGPKGDWLMGAPDVLLAQAVDPDAAERAGALVDDHSRQGQRVLLLSRVNGEPGDTAPPNEPVAVLALEERVRADAADTLAYFGRQGVAIKVISGDDPRTVGAVADRVGIPGADQPMDARDLPEDMEELADRLETTSVFGRVAPHQKQAMVKALQSRGHTVAMTGDGVNDVLALKEADLGVAMGSGSAASRAVAPIVLMDSSFASLPSVLAEGRQVIANVERVANLFLTKTVYATLLALAVGVAQLPFPFLPRHLTIISSLTIGVPAFFLALAPNNRRYRPGFVGRVLRFAVPAGAVAATATMAAYALARDTEGVGQTEARTIATITLFLVALWVLAILARPASPWRAMLIAAMAVAFVLVLAIPGLRDFFGINLPSRLVVLSAVGLAAMAGVALDLGWQASGWVSEWLSGGFHHHDPAEDCDPRTDEDCVFGVDTGSDASADTAA